MGRRSLMGRGPGTQAWRVDARPPCAQVGLWDKALRAHTDWHTGQRGQTVTQAPATWGLGRLLRWARGG